MTSISSSVGKNHEWGPSINEMLILPLTNNLIKPIGCDFAKQMESQTAETWAYRAKLLVEDSWASDAMGNFRAAPSPNWAFLGWVPWTESCFQAASAQPWATGHQQWSRGDSAIPPHASLPWGIQLQPWLHIRLNGEGLKIFSIDRGSCLQTDSLRPQKWAHSSIAVKIPPVILMELLPLRQT